MRHAGVRSLREDGLVVLDHAEPGDLKGHERLEVADFQSASFYLENAAIDRRGAQDLAHPVDDLLGTFSDRADRFDLPRLLPLAGQLDEVFAVGTMDGPAAAGQSIGDAEVEVDGEVAEER